VPAVTTTQAIPTDLKATLRRLKLGPMLDTLPERMTLAKQQKIPYADFLLMVLQDEVSRRDGLAAARRAHQANLDPAATLDTWDTTAKVTFDQQLLNELATLRFLEAREHVAVVGPVGVGKTFLSYAIGHVACRRKHSVLALRADKLLKSLRHARLDNSYERELRRLIAVDLLIVDDFGLDQMDAQESRDAYEIFVERHRSGSMIVTSNRGPDEWLATFSDPLRAQAAIDRFCGSAHELVIDGESYRSRQKPGGRARSKG
jgi:DNA replication protein DnaC